MSKDELKSVLKELKVLAKLKKDLGRRGENIFALSLDEKASYEVEYFGGMSEEDAFSQAESVYKKVFSDSPKKEDVIMTKKDSLKWGIRVYKNDQRVDLSFSKIEKLLK